MEFTKETFYKRIYKEVRRKPRHVELREWTYPSHADLGLAGEEELWVYTGLLSDFDDLTHFYFQTLRVQAEADGDDWKDQLEQVDRGRRLVASQELRDRPWNVTFLDAQTFNRLVERISAALPSRAVSGWYRDGVLMGEATWERTHVLARFERLFIRIDLVNLA